MLRTTQINETGKTDLSGLNRVPPVTAWARSVNNERKTTKCRSISNKPERYWTKMNSKQINNGQVISAQSTLRE